MHRIGRAPAEERARVAWSEMANAARFDIRAMGVQGTLRTLSNVATGARGMNAPTQLTKLAMEMRNGGVPEAVTAARLANVAAQIVGLVYHDTRNGAA